MDLNPSPDSTSPDSTLTQYMAKTLFEKIWQDHLIADLGDGSSLLHIDRVFLHERTGSIALRGMAERHRQVRNPRQVFLYHGSRCRYFPRTGG